MVIRWKITIPELTGDSQRTAYLYFPESYGREPSRRYPVLYMFDGHNVFFDSDATYGKCWGMQEYMDHAHTQMIIAAVECNHSPDNGRLREYSPYTFSDPQFGRITGQGRHTMDWFVHTFKPYIDSRYRTLPDRKNTFIAGSSMGGLMSLYAVMAYNSYFSRGAALSPYMHAMESQLTDLIRHSHIQSDTVLYMDYGSEELKTHPDTVKGFGRICSRLMEKGVSLESRIVPGGEHCEASWERQIPFFMNTLLYRP